MHVHAALALEMSVGRRERGTKRSSLARQGSERCAIGQRCRRQGEKMVRAGVLAQARKQDLSALVADIRVGHKVSKQKALELGVERQWAA